MAASNEKSFEIINDLKRREYCYWILLIEWPLKNDKLMKHDDPGFEIGEISHEKSIVWMIEKNQLESMI